MATRKQLYKNIFVLHNDVGYPEEFEKQLASLYKGFCRTMVQLN
jgi:hypothetical protein